MVRVIPLKRPITKGGLGVYTSVLLGIGAALSASCSTSPDGTNAAMTAGGGDSSSSSSSSGVGGGDPCAPGRSTTDRLDDSDDYQVRVNYALPSDGPDESLDTNGQIAASVSAFRTWFSAQAPGRSIRMDTCGGALDVRFIQLTKTDAELKSEGVFIRDAIEALMKEQDLMHPKKLELVYYGGDAAEVCASGPWPPTLVGRVVAIYLKGSFADPSIPDCGQNPIGASPTEPGYIEFAAIHEIFHGLGAAPDCAPNHTLSGHVSDDPTDLMYAGALPWQPSILDVGHDDYFEHGSADCLDIARSVFIEPSPAGAQIPPGW